MKVFGHFKSLLSVYSIMSRDDWQRIEMYQSEIEKLICLFLKRSSEIVASLFSFCGAKFINQ